jgi:hypothetical protein
VRVTLTRIPIREGGNPVLHTHFSAVNALNTFLGVLIVGTLWRLVSLHLVASNSAQLQHAGKAMSFQY